MNTAQNNLADKLTDLNAAKAKVEAARRAMHASNMGPGYEALVDAYWDACEEAAHAGLGL
jgi:hypothetical protein